MIEIGMKSFPEIFLMKGMAQEVCWIFTKFFPFFKFSLPSITSVNWDYFSIYIQMGGRILVLHPTSLSEFTER
jgi:hypothetical protein